MKGLFIKDFFLAFRNSRSLLIFTFICLVMSLSMDPVFGVGYGILLMGTLALGTLTYDEYDNGFPFLMSLPINARTYIREKFLFCFLAEMIGAAAGVLFSLLASLIRKQPIVLEDYLSFAAGMLPALYLMQSLMIALQLKFGAEKSRLVMMIVYGGFAGIAIFVGSMKDQLLPKLSGTIAFLQGQPALLLLGTLLLIFLLLVGLLYIVSVKIMENKEF
ncbi:MAG: ABC-2 transporter permease [Erysipelotrichaceae bacterium]|nr:ABC-2 transporter permease [Erysipelotrichaceae bacterium]